MCSRRRVSPSIGECDLRDLHRPTVDGNIDVNVSGATAAPRIDKARRRLICLESSCCEDMRSFLKCELLD
jgi:hypothetical protein